LPAALLLNRHQASVGDASIYLDHVNSEWLIARTQPQHVGSGV